MISFKNITKPSTANTVKTLLTTGILFLSSYLLNAQINAVTSSGDEVILYYNGTWRYANDTTVTNKEINTNNTLFEKDKKQTFLVKSSKVNVGVWINPKEWVFTKGKEGEAAEYQFRKKDGDLYAILITEKLEIPIETLKEVALGNARSAAPDIRLLKEEYRTVNGKKLLMMQMNGTIQGMKFTYYSYYYSSSNGTIQLITYTGENLFNSYLNDIERFLNGFVEL